MVRDFKLTLVFVLLLIGSSLAQMNGELLMVSQVLGRANVSGSISYWGREACTLQVPEHNPVAPFLRRAHASEPIVAVLQEMFAGDPRMQVTQEPNGIVRMVETDVPTDLLDVKIHHLSFDVPGYYGPNMAIQLILSAPEVVRFGKAHNIQLLPDLTRGPSDAGRNNPSVTGTLDDVTVSQALDHIFQTYSGLWIYGNCPNGGKRKERAVYFWFFRSFPPKG